MKQESIHHPQQKSYPRDPQIRAYYNDDDGDEDQDADPAEDHGQRDSIRDWQNPSRFKRGGFR